MPQSKATTVPLICGGVYEYIDPRTGLPERVLVTATKREVGGNLTGIARKVGSGYEEEFVEGDETMVGWSLVAQPEELAEPISAGDIVEHENVSLKRQLAASKERVAELERMVRKNELTDEKLVEAVVNGSKWGEVGKPYGMGWKEVKDRFETLAAEGEQDGASPAAKLAAKALRLKQKTKDEPKAQTEGAAAAK